MFRSGDSAAEKSALGRAWRSILALVSRLPARFGARSRGVQPGGHLGPRRALRLSAIFAPRNRLKIGAAAFAIIIAGALIALLASDNHSALPLDNAIWLDGGWTYGDLDEAGLRAFSDSLRENQIGTAFAYVSSLGIDNRWSGGAQGKSGFTESRAQVEEFARSFKSQNDSLRLFGWIEIWAHLDNIDGYRLDDDSVHSLVAEFSRLLVEDIGFDGVLLDVKPLFRDNNDLIRLIRSVRGALGPAVPIAVAVTADLTPDDLQLRDIGSIAPGTMWSASFKKQVMVHADLILLLMYQSYRQAPRDYINWVAYHVETYLNELETATEVLVSIPNYGGASSAHNPAIETLENALEGVSVGLQRLDEEKRARLTGIAIYSDARLSQTDWNAFNELWLQR